MIGWLKRRNGEEDRPVSGAEWVVRMRCGTLGEHERKTMQRWMAESPEHARDLLRAEAAWRLSGALANDAQVQRELEELDSPRPASRVHGRPGRGTRIARAYVTATAILVLGIGVALWLLLAPGGYQTAHGEQRVVTLADGSVIALNTDTLLQVDLSSMRRDVFMQRG